ncbi:MAG: CdaR family protein [Sandaracinaceae bacterium]|nr:CdaR family protein [Sandaracinaceae bacterium]
MTQSASSKSFLRRALTENVGLKILALAAAIGLFVIVRGTEDAQMSVPVSVVALMPPASSNRMLISELPDEVRVTLRGSRSVLNAVRRGGLTPIQMDLRDAQGHFYYFAQEGFELPAGATIVQIAPSAVPLRWVPRAERRLPVQALLEGEVAEGHVIVQTTVEPSSVTAQGAASEVSRLEEVRTAAVEVGGLRAGRHERRVPLGLLPEHVSYLESERTALVVVTVEEEIGTRTFADIDVSVVGATDVTVRPAQVSVVVRGPRARVNDLHPRRLVPFVDVTEVEPSRGAQPVPVLMRAPPEGMTVTVEPSEVLVTLPAR